MTCIIIPIFYKKNLENKDKNKSKQNKKCGTLIVTVGTRHKKKRRNGGLNGTP